MRQILTFLALIAASTGQILAACGGSNVAIASAGVQGVTRYLGLNQYHITARVTNAGGIAQPTNTLQFVNFYRDGQKLDAKGIPPLRPGESYTISYMVARSSDAGVGTTQLALQLDMLQPACMTPNPYTVTF